MGGNSGNDAGTTGADRDECCGETANVSPLKAEGATPRDRGSHKGHCGRRSDRTHGTGRPAYPATPLKIYVYGYLKSCSLEAGNRFCARSYQTRQDHSSAEGALHGIERILHESYVGTRLAVDRLQDSDLCRHKLNGTY